MNVRAKMYLQTITLSPANDGGEVVLSAVCRGELNKDWAKWTPSGSLRMQIANGPAFEFFESILRDKRDGKIEYPEVFLTIERATEEA